ncbi:MAG TPA: cytochrome c3 family protein [Anaerolineales bacterium]|nr:cytochrome c3 family protein [Anaerolineales bacterium]
MNRWILRTGVGLAVALPLALFGAAMAGAGDSTQTGIPPDVPCQICHSEIEEAWVEGAHGHATVDPTFRTAWEQQGKPRECLTCHTTGYDPVTDTYEAEGVTCEACHSPVPANHPADPMPAERSASLCGNCHTETMFEWQASKHRETELACIGCHDPHAASLKKADSAGLCATCHRERASNFAHSQHSEVGLNCADCHLATLDGQEGEGHAVRDHSFNVKLTTCNVCHAYQMHDPVEVHLDRSTPGAQDAMASVETLSVQPEPSPVSPVGFAALSGLIGMASGMILAPWLERWYRRLRQDGDEVEREADDE